jgi:hypothetical protein
MLVVWFIQVALTISSRNVVSFSDDHICRDWSEDSIPISIPFHHKVKNVFLFQQQQQRLERDPMER